MTDEERADAVRTVLPRLRAAILAGEYLPGARLVEATLCARFGASRFAVRTALRDLVTEGLVELRRHRGAHVRAVTPQEAVEIAEARRVLEGLVAARAAERATARDRDTVTGIADAMRAAVDAGDHEAYGSLNARLHRTLQEIAAHGAADILIDTLRGPLVRHQYRLALVPGRPSVSLSQHERIVAAVVAGDPVEAEAAMRDHLASVVEALRALP